MLWRINRSIGVLLLVGSPLHGSPTQSQSIALSTPSSRLFGMQQQHGVCEQERWAVIPLRMCVRSRHMLSAVCRSRHKLSVKAD